MSANVIYKLLNGFVLIIIKVYQAGHGFILFIIHHSLLIWLYLNKTYHNCR